MARISIEDCLDVVQNRFALVTVAADRTRQLMDGFEPFVKSKNREQVTALREIAEGHIVAKVPESLLKEETPDQPDVPQLLTPT